MIEVTVTCNGHVDRAEADSPEAALSAASVLYEEAYRANGGAFEPRCAFFLDGRLVAMKEGRP